MERIKRTTYNFQSSRFGKCKTDRQQLRVSQHDTYDKSMTSINMTMLQYAGAKHTLPLPIQIITVLTWFRIKIVTLIRAQLNIKHIQCHVQKKVRMTTLMSCRMTDIFSACYSNYLGSPFHAILVHNPFSPFSFWCTTYVKHESPFCTNHSTTWLYISFFSSGFPIAQFCCPLTLWAIWVFSPTRAEEEPLIVRFDDRFC